MTVSSLIHFILRQQAYTRNEEAADWSVIFCEQRDANRILPLITVLPPITGTKKMSHGEPGVFSILGILVLSDETSTKLMTPYLCFMIFQNFLCY